MIPNRLKKCPVCGEDARVSYYEDEYSGNMVYYVECNHCEIRIDADDKNTDDESRESAIQKWNNLPRVFEVKKGNPDEEGWYLVREFNGKSHVWNAVYMKNFNWTTIPLTYVGPLPEPVME